MDKEGFIEESLSTRYLADPKDQLQQAVELLEYNQRDYDNFEDLGYIRELKEKYNSLKTKKAKDKVLAKIEEKKRLLESSIQRYKDDIKECNRRILLQEELEKVIPILNRYRYNRNLPRVYTDDLHLFASNEFFPLSNEYLAKVREIDKELLSIEKQKKELREELFGDLEFLQTPDGVVYGWTIGGKIFLTEQGMNAETPIHEYTHLWANAMRKNNEQGWESVKDLLRGTPMWNEVLADKNYSSIHDNEDLVASEVLSRYSGKENAKRLEDEAKRMLDEANGIGAKADAVSLIDRVRRALQKFWDWVGKDLFGIEKFDSIEAVSDRVLYDLMNQTDLNAEVSEGESQQERYSLTEEEADLQIKQKLNDLQRAESIIKDWVENNKRGNSFEIKLPAQTQRMVKRAMGKGYNSHNITANGIAHGFNNHGENGKKLGPNSIPARMEDAVLIPYIMTAPDRVEKGSTDIRNRESVRFYKNLSNGYIVVIEKEQMNSSDDMETINFWIEMSPEATNAQQNVVPDINVRNAILSSDVAKIRKDSETAIIKDVKSTQYSLQGGRSVASEYERRVNTKGKGGALHLSKYNAMEAMQDEMRSLKEVQRIIEDEHGIKLESYEDAYKAENALSSKNLAEWERYIGDVYEPMMQIIDKWINKGGETEQSINYYLIAKSGLERNREFTVRDAFAEIETHILCPIDFYWTQI